MAEMLPDAPFVGLDLSEKQIAQGQQTIAALGLSNIQLKQQNLLDAGADPGLHLSAPVQPIGVCNLRPQTDAQFRCSGDITISARDPIVKAALLVLADAWPASLPFHKLRTLARARLQTGPILDSATVAEDTQELGRTFWRFYAQLSTQGLHLSVRPFPGVNKVSPRPIARGLIRWQAKQGKLVTNLHHQLVPLNDFQRQLLTHLDGQHTHADLLGFLVDLFGRNEVTVQHDGEPVTDPQKAQSLLEAALP